MNINSYFGYFVRVAKRAEIYLGGKLARELLWPLLSIDDVIGELPENAGFD